MVQQKNLLLSMFNWLLIGCWYFICCFNIISPQRRKGSVFFYVLESSQWRPAICGSTGIANPLTQLPKGLGAVPYKAVFWGEFPTNSRLAWSLHMLGMLPRSFEMPSRPLLGTGFSGWAASWMSARTNRGLDGPDGKKRMAWWNNLVDLEIGQMMVNLITAGYSMDICGGIIWVNKR